MRPPPVVTGISPAEGPPGTRVTIRGEHLGINLKDIVGLTICDANCLLLADYKSTSKIITRTGQAKPGKGEVIVTTKSGGVGSCTVQFKSQPFIPDPLRDSAFWIEEVDPEETPSGSARPVSPTLNIDPLGIAADVFGYRVPEDQLEDLFPEGSGNIVAENFYPEWFLLEKHCDTNFDTLKYGLRHLKDEQMRRAKGPLAFVKDNLGTFLDSLATLISVQKKMLRDESDCDGGSIAEQLESILQGASKNADALFQDVLSRKDDADRTRNALNVLQRFRFLFSLPSSIDRNIKQGEYEMVISDYGRAKSLFAETDIKVFKKVLQEVENKIESFKMFLNGKIQEFPSPLDEQKRFIRYLVELDYSGDPAWECLVNQHSWLIKLLNSCQQDHQSKDVAPFLQVDGAGIHADIIDKRNPVSFRPDSPSVGRKSSASKQSTIDRHFRNSQSTPQRVQFVEELSELVTETLPDLWKLGQAYFSQTLLGEESSSSNKQLSPSRDKETQYQDMINDITSLYTKLVSNAFFASSSQDSVVWSTNMDGLAAWLPACVRNARSCLLSLSCLGLPPSSLSCVYGLVDNLRLLCATEVFKDATAEIKTLHCNELWNLEKDEDIGRITSLPLLFENIVMETLHTLEEITRESNVEESHCKVKERGTQLFKEMFLAFIDCLHQLSFQPEQDQLDRASVSSQSDEYIDRSTYSLDDNIPVIDERLLIVLNNCRYVRKHVLTKLVHSFKKQSYPMSDDLTQSLQGKLENLEKKIFDAYIEQKSESIVGNLEPGMSAGDFRWYDCLAPNDVRHYVKEVIMNLVVVHAQVFAVSCDLLPQVLSALSSLVAGEFKRLLDKASQSKRKFMSMGAVTAHLEATALQEALQSYLTKESRTTFQEALKVLPPLSKESDKKLIDALMAKFRRKMALQLLCFQVNMDEI